MAHLQWLLDQASIDWTELSDLYRIAPLGEKSAEHLRLAFSNSMFKCFVLSDGKLVGAGRAVADGIDCSYLCDVAVHPDFQGQGLGKAIIAKLFGSLGGTSEDHSVCQPRQGRLLPQTGIPSHAHGDGDIREPGAGDRPRPVGRRVSRDSTAAVSSLACWLPGHHP